MKDSKRVRKFIAVRSARGKVRSQFLFGHTNRRNKRQLIDAILNPAGVVRLLEARNHSCVHYPLARFISRTSPVCAEFDTSLSILRAHEQQKPFVARVLRGTTLLLDLAPFPQAAKETTPHATGAAAR